MPSEEYPEDDQIWLPPDSGLTWYYNYKAEPSPSYEDVAGLEFVPMLWGAPPAPREEDNPESFTAIVGAQLDDGANITHVLGFNEPDASVHGGSGVDPALAASTWIREMEPLRERGVSLGAPAVTGSQRGLAWLENFFRECDGRCNVDFMPIHFYGPFEPLASFMGQIRQAYPDMDIWVTEYGLPNSELEPTQDLFNVSMEYFDRLDFVARYTYFGSFRSDVSNVGPNAAMLTHKGELTDIGSWYLGRTATGNIPRGDGARTASFFAGASILILFSIVWSFL